jgi:hypothetical protein
MTQTGMLIEAEIVVPILLHLLIRVHFDLQNCAAQCSTTPAGALQVASYCCEYV